LRVIDFVIAVNVNRILLPTCFRNRKRAMSMGVNVTDGDRFVAQGSTTSMNTIDVKSFVDNQITIGGVTVVAALLVAIVIAAVWRVHRRNFKLNVEGGYDSLSYSSELAPEPESDGDDEIQEEPWPVAQGVSEYEGDKEEVVWWSKASIPSRKRSIIDESPQPTGLESPNV